MTDTIKKYIEFAIENGYTEIKSFSEIIDTTVNYKVESKIDGKIVYRNINLYQLITSRPFIDAVVSGAKQKILRLNAPEQMGAYDMFIFTQALAIYNGTLEDFINNLLPKKDLG